jgi:hypothetical protein
VEEEGGEEGMGRVKVPTWKFEWDIRTHCAHGQWDFFRRWHRADPYQSLIDMFRILAETRRAQEEIEARDYEAECQEMLAQQEGLAFGMDADDTVPMAAMDAENSVEAEEEAVETEEAVEEAEEEAVEEAPIIAVRSGRRLTPEEWALRGAEAVEEAPIIAVPSGQRLTPEEWALLRAEKMEDLVDEWESSRY